MSIWFRYHVQVPAGSTRYLLLFAQVHTDTNAAETDATAFNSVTSSSDLVEGIGSKVRSKIVNWNL